MKYKLSILIIFVTLIFPFGVSATTFRITQEINPQRVRVGENVTLTISMSVIITSRHGSTVTNFAKHFTPPNLSNFTIIDTSQSTKRQIGITNGSYFQEFSNVYTYILQPKKEGKIRISSATMVVKGHKYYSNRLLLTVLPPKMQPLPVRPGINPNPKFAGDEFAFVTVSNFSPYQGEAVVVSWYIYTFSRLVQKPISDLPDAPGFFSKQLFSSNHTYEMKRVQVGRTPYFKTLVFKRMYWPQKSGKLTIGRRSITYFTRSGMFSYNTKNEVQISAPIVLNVKPLPLNGKPKNFNEDNIGKFKISIDLASTSIKLNEAIDLNITIKGEGLVTAINFDNFPKLDWARIENNGLPEIKENIYKEQKIKGIWRGKYILIPTKPGNHIFPSLEFHYFNPQLGRYQTAKSKKVKLRITGKLLPKHTKQTLQSSGKNQLVNTYKQKENLLIPTIKPLHLTPTLKSSIRSDFYKSMIFKFFLYVPFFTWLGIGIFLLIKKRRNLNSEIINKKRAKTNRKKSLAIAKRSIKDNNSDIFYSELTKALLSILSEVASQNIQGLTNSEISEILANKQLDSKFISEIVEFLETLDFARYAPVSSDSSTEKSELFKRAKSLITKLEKL